MDWPSGADGDVFRSLQAKGFDFSRKHYIDVNLDFDHWPLSETELSEIKSLYEGIEVVEPEQGEDIGNGKDIGFLQFQVYEHLTYEFITDLQSKISVKMSQYGGWCNSWGLISHGNTGDS